MIGEVGLDFSRADEIEKRRQIEFLEKVFLKFPRNIITIHCKNAENELIALIEKYGLSRHIIHWFNGNGEQLKRLIDTGAYFSINGNMVRTDKQVQLLKTIPQNRILIESDGPYSKIRDKKYSPEQLGELYEVVAKKLEIVNLEKLVYVNMSNLFL